MGERKLQLDAALRHSWRSSLVLHANPSPVSPQVCVSLEDWQEFPVQFEGSTSMKERSLYKSLISISEFVCEAKLARSLCLSFGVRTFIVGFYSLGENS
jgi:hypothetical protein